MKYEFVDPSPQALDATEDNRYKKKYDFPFDVVPVGKSFRVELSQVSSFAVLRVTADRYAKKLNRKFRCVNHGDAYEVACISELPPVATPGASETEDNLPKWTPPKHD